MWNFCFLISSLTTILRDAPSRPLTFHEANFTWNCKIPHGISFHSGLNRASPPTPWPYHNLWRNLGYSAPSSPFFSPSLSFFGFVLPFSCLSKFYHRVSSTFRFLHCYTNGLSTLNNPLRKPFHLMINNFLHPVTFHLLVSSSLSPTRRSLVGGSSPFSFLKHTPLSRVEIECLSLLSEGRQAGNLEQLH